MSARPHIAMVVLLFGTLLGGCNCGPERSSGARVRSQGSEESDEVSFEVKPEIARKLRGESPRVPLRDPVPEPVARAAEERNRALFEESPEVREYFARQGACDPTLEISLGEAGPFKEVYRAGPEDPKARLRWHAYQLGRFIIRGRFTGRTERVPSCGYYPEFELLSFKPWGPVRRCTSVAALNGEMRLYTEHLPKDRYAPEDFVDGPELLEVDDTSCRRAGRCEKGEVLVEDCSSTEREKSTWCCRLLPPLELSEDGRGG